MAKKDNERPHVLPTDINRPFRAVDRSPKLNLNLSEFFSSNSLQRQSLLFTFYSLLKEPYTTPDSCRAHTPHTSYPTYAPPISFKHDFQHYCPPSIHRHLLLPHVFRPLRPFSRCTRTSTHGRRKRTCKPHGSYIHPQGCPRCSCT